MRAAAHRGVYGPGDPETQVAAVLAPDRSRPGRLRRRTFNGRTFDLISAPLPDGGYVVCAVEITSLIAARADAERALTQIPPRWRRCSLGWRRSGPAGHAAVRQSALRRIAGPAAGPCAAGHLFPALLDLMAARDEFAGADGAAFLAAQRSADRSHPATVRRIRGNGQVIDVTSDPLPDGGWTMAVTDITPLARAEDESSRRRARAGCHPGAIPHGVCVYGADHRVTHVQPDLSPGDVRRAARRLAITGSM